MPKRVGAMGEGTPTGKRKDEEWGKRRKRQRKRRGRGRRGAMKVTRRPRGPKATKPYRGDG